MNTIGRRLHDKQIVRVMFLGALASPKLVEMAGGFQGLHGVWFDQEHAAVSHERLELLVMACRAAGLDSFVRVAPTDYTAIMRPYETGASGVMVAQIRSLAQVQQVVEWSKYPPQGVRGLFSGNFEARYGAADLQQHVRDANAQRWLAIQVETAEALDAADAIAATAGVDLLFVGPNDLACALGVPGEPMHPTCLAALERVAQAARSADKPWGILSRGPEHAARCRALGCSLFSVVGDLDLVRSGFQATRALYEDLFHEEGHHQG